MSAAYATCSLLADVSGLPLVMPTPSLGSGQKEPFSICPMGFGIGLTSLDELDHVLLLLPPRCSGRWWRCHPGQLELLPCRFGNTPAWPTTEIPAHVDRG